MTKLELATQIAIKTGIEPKHALKFVEAFMLTVKENLANGEEIYLRGFGSFIIKTRKTRIARNMSQNTSLVVPEHKAPVFKIAKAFQDIITEAQELKEKGKDVTLIPYEDKLVVVDKDQADLFRKKLSAMKAAKADYQAVEARSKNGNITKGRKSASKPI